MVESRSELIKAVVSEIRNPVNKTQKDYYRYIVDCYSGTGIKTIEITNFAGHFCIIVHYQETQKETSYIVEKGLSTLKGASCWQGISLTPRSPAYIKFKEELEKGVCYNA